MNTRIRTLLAALAVSLAVPAVALAGSPDDSVALKKGDKSKRTKRKKRKKSKADKPSFPMAGDAFTARIEARINKANDRMEARLAKSKMADEKKDAIRKRFAAKATNIRAAAKKATADKTVTKAEAKEVRKVARKHARKKKGDRKNKKGDRKNKRSNKNRKRA